MLSWFGLALAATDGEVVGVVFSPDGAPVADAVVVAGDGRTLTDAYGAWRLRLPPGTTAVSIVVRGGAPMSTQVPVVAGRTTELLATVGPSAAFSVEAPSDAEVGSEVPSGPPGTLRGVVTDDGGQPLAQARIFVRGSAVEALTGADGRFVVELPEGTWDLSAVRAGFGTTTASFEVVADASRDASLTLARSGLLLDALVVKAPKVTGGTAYLLDERQDASTVSDVLGAEQMARAGDADAASALRRVTGLTVIGGKYVYVRGLGDRYSATLLDGSPLPSPEPEKRVVPLDLFPAPLLDSVVVQKTFSPDRPAEFGGGLVEIRTRSVPEEPLFSVSLSGTWVADTTLTRRAVGESGPTDVLGFGVGHRALPDEVAAASDEQAIKAGGIFSEEGYSADELERFGELLPDRWGLGEARTLPMDLGFTITTGGSVDAGSARLGGLAGLVFSSGWDVEEGFQTLYSQGASGLEAKRTTTFTEVGRRARLGGALALGTSWEAGEVSSTTLLLRNSSGTALSYDADDPTGSNDTSNGRVDWVEQQLLFQQVSVEQALGEHVRVAARYAGALASGDEPDRRDWTYLRTEQGLVLSQRSSWSEILYTSLDDTTHDLAVDLELGSVKAGGEITLRRRTSTTRRFGYQFQGSEGIDLSAPIEDVIVPANIGAASTEDPGYLELEENTTSSDDYTATQHLHAGYLMVDHAWSRRLSTLLGARVEASSQEVSTYELFDPSRTPVAAELATVDPLPAATLTVGVGRTEDPSEMLVRAGYGRTLSRPELRELASVGYYDYRSGRLLFGNPDLQRATIDNVDVRWEWYPSDGQSVSAGAFFKSFTEPVESVVAVSAVSGSVGTFANARSATNLGLEVDLRERLVADLWLSANGSPVASSVDLSGTSGNQTSTRRPLQGQSPWVVNAQLSWEDPDARRQVALLYNAFGPRIVDVGTSGIPDTYELPVHRLDLVATEGLGDDWSLRIKGTNLLDQPTRERTGDQLAEEVRDGWSAGLSVTWQP